MICTRTPLAEDFLQQLCYPSASNGVAATTNCCALYKSVGCLIVITERVRVMCVISDGDSDIVGVSLQALQAANLNEYKPNLVQPSKGE